jgi:hypothetical protein
VLGRLATLLGLAFLGSLHAADLYRWVDESGRTHISDTVPEQYRKSATRTDARKFEVSDEQRREAEARAERDRAKVRSNEEDRARAASPESGRPAPAAAGPKPAATSDCAELHRRYRESLDCFAPYVMANGATKSEAYTKCTVVKDPSSQCGAPGSRESTSRTY